MPWAGLPAQGGKATMDPKDEAIIELAHMATSLLEALEQANALPGIFREAITNKIEFYKAQAAS